MEKLKLIKRLLEDKKAEDIVILDVSELTNIADFFVIATANSEIHARSLAEYLEQELERHGYSLHHIEGLESGKWILVDALDIIIHIFTRDWREYYGIEWLWSEAKRLTV